MNAGAGMQNCSAGKDSFTVNLDTIFTAEITNIKSAVLKIDFTVISGNSPVRNLNVIVAAAADPEKVHYS